MNRVQKRMAESPIIETIREKIERIMAENRRLRQETRDLTRQRDKFKAGNRELTTRIAELEKRISVLELSRGIAGGSDDAKLAKARVNRLMREVDRCIALLNRE